MVFISVNSESWLQIGLSFLAAIIGACLGGLINLLIHRSGLKHARIENQKDRDARSVANNTQLTVAILEYMKVNNTSPEELVNIINDSVKAVNLINKLNQDKKEDIKKSNDDNEKLDNDIIKWDREGNYGKQD